MGQKSAKAAGVETLSTAKESRFDAILDSAETVFARSGYEGATMREIAERAGVAQGLIHYHFKTKEVLFEAMVSRRSKQINEGRAALLDRIMEQGETPDLEPIVEALFRPTIEAGISQASNGGAFAQILVSTANSAQEREQLLTEKYYDPIAQKFISAFMEVQPGLTRANAVWAYMFAIGVGMTMMAKTGRPARLSDGLCNDGDADEMLIKIVPFICSGIRALS
ncbi:TetR/AcrR family transcriptional regulator [Neptunicoccus cionae]|uniref:Transcriptional regulator, TetR family protein n=1 Tax=Neptunicoccus cionae TaxID=2035344 RepID=A0A916VQJ8_9RHOB|nr:TetR/AcrR family transcriptional regulator [Amylibacter cionae]GGA20973.1 putative transcriptional regulator, TetR family protein [Amylibacter cionae]